MTPPMTPREKVEPCYECGSTERIGTACAPCNPEITALASGSGDHAELARLADDALSQKGRWDELHDLNKFHAAANPARVLALLSEIAALRVQVETEKRLSVKNWNVATARATQAERQRDELREALIQADLTIRSMPGTDQSDVEFIRQALANQGADQ